MSYQAEISLPQLRQNLAEFSDLSLGEFDCDLESILRSPDDEISIKRIGRLMAITIKQPFAETFPYDPELPWNWAKSHRAWEILGPIPTQLKEKHANKYQFLIEVTESCGRPEYKIAEWHVFNAICDKIKFIVCEESELLNETNEIAEKLKESGSPVSALSSTEIIGSTSVAIASWLSTKLNLSTELLPIITGTTLLLVCFGKNRLCNFLLEFKESQKSNPDPFVDYPKCGSLKTFDGQPCDNEVLSAGELCWKHK